MLRRVLDWMAKSDWNWTIGILVFMAMMSFIIFTSANIIFGVHHNVYTGVVRGGIHYRLDSRVFNNLGTRRDELKMYYSNGKVVEIKGTAQGAYLRQVTDQRAHTRTVQYIERLGSKTILAGASYQGPTPLHTETVEDALADAQVELQTYRWIATEYHPSRT